MKKAYVIDALRTPIGRVGGSLGHLEPHQLLAPLISALIRRCNIPVENLDEVIVGNAAGPGGNPARVALLAAGLPNSVPGLTVDRQCGSGLEAINIGARLIQSGAASLVIAGGVESASSAPLRARKMTDEVRSQSQFQAQSQSDLSLPQLPNWQFYRRARFTPPGMDDPGMGVAAENVAQRYGISREAQDEYAVESHRRAVAAEKLGHFAAERLVMQLPHGEVSSDECPRSDCTMERLAALPAVFQTQGTVTAGNACPINDGAALVLMSDQPLSDQSLEFMGAAAAGVSPALLGIGPVPATHKLLTQLGLAIDDLDRIEFNEAFAAQVLASAGTLKLPLDRMNVDGGALALGHPYGASGAVLVARLFSQLEAGQAGLATLGIGGGLGLSTLFRCV